MDSPDRHINARPVLCDISNQLLSSKTNSPVDLGRINQSAFTTLSSSSLTDHEEAVVRKQRPAASPLTNDQKKRKIEQQRIRRASVKKQGTINESQENETPLQPILEPILIGSAFNEIDGVRQAITEQNGAQGIAWKPLITNILTDDGGVVRKQRKATSPLTNDQKKRKLEQQRSRRASVKKQVTINESQENAIHPQQNILENNAIGSASNETDGVPIAHIEQQGINQGCKLKATNNSLVNIAKNPCARPDKLDVGQMNNKCNHCDALHFLGEKNSRKQFTSCCRNGQVHIAALLKYPPLLLNFLKLVDGDSRNFFKNIRKYNSAFALASFGHQQVKFNRGPQAFVIHGQVYHKTSASTNGEKSTYSQLYILDPEFATNERMTRNEACKKEIMKNVDTLLREINPYAKAYKMMKDVMDKCQLDDLPTVSMWLVRDRQKDARTYNLPVANEVAAVFKSEDGEPPFKRDICVHPKNENRLIQMCILSPNCDPMTYPLLFPHGEFGWQPFLPRCSTRGSRNTLSMQEFYGYRLQEREEFSPILHAGSLTQQFVVDSYLKIEANKLNWIKENQTKLRAELYLGLMDYVNSEAEKQNIKAGKLCILPSSFIGSKRALQQGFQDAMAMVAKYGRPDLFITFTCNPNWPEIKNNLKNMETTIDRPDIVATVFHLKLTEFITDLVKNRVLGTVRSYIYVIEFQKRGLPHCHMLFVMEEDSKIREPEQCDLVVVAEIPCKQEDLELYEIVKSTMVHGPCGCFNPVAPCMDEIEGKPICTKKFPKKFTEETILNLNGYPEYRRRNDGKTIKIRDMDVDNRWIVPYNPYLTRKYSAHINVEICSSVKSVKYIFKYVYKGHDAGVVRISEQGDTFDWDEVKMYLDTRYISSPEAMWRIREYKMHDRMHFIQRLAVHLPNQQRVVFQEQKEKEALAAAEKNGTTLTAWFDLNKNEPEARQYLYTEVPLHYTYSTYCWKKRKMGKVLPRMYTVSPKDMEKFSLRLLLLHVRGAKSFEDLRTINGKLYDTFKEAAKSMHLLDDDTEWIKTLEEASFIKMPGQLRLLFATILTSSEPTDPKLMYTLFKEDLAEDYMQKYDEYSADQLTLKDIEFNLNQFGRCCKDYGLPTPDPNFVHENNVECFEKEKTEAEKLISSMNEEQTYAYNQIIQAVYGKSQQKSFYLSGAGGCGKTYVYKALIYSLLGRGDKVKVVAPTGLAATLLKNGQTVHSGFRLPVNVNESSVTNLTHRCKEWEVFKNIKLIIWDEISMCHAQLFKAVDRSLKDLFNSNELFGGIPIVIGGDFRQQAPVVKNGSRVNIVEACVKSCQLWTKFSELKLTRNMRVDPAEIEFQKWLLNIGSGVNESGGSEEYVQISSSMLSQNIIEDVFGQDINSLSTLEIAERAILCPKNEDTFTVNECILNSMEGDKKVYFSQDSIIESELEESSYPIEFLNSLTPMGMPPHILSLKIGSCVMLLRNLNPKQGLCNGTRLIVSHMGENIIECTVFSGDKSGTRVFVPRIKLDVKDGDLPFELRRKQFPLRLAYSMTITKSQGQTFEKIGVYLPRQVFTHGQLYTAFSRVKRRSALKVEIHQTSRQGVLDDLNNTYTYNCVYREIL